MQKPRILISACVYGHQVRYDGRDQSMPDLITWLQPEYQLQPLCPEVGIGLTVPRRPIQCNVEHQVLRVQDREHGTPDYTEALSLYAEQQDLDHCIAYIGKARSPSCGAGSTPWYAQGQELKTGDGLVVHKLRERHPEMLFIDADLLHTLGAGIKSLLDQQYQWYMTEGRDKAVETPFQAEVVRLLEQ